MQKDYDMYERYGDEMQNVGVSSREHEQVDKLLREDRALFGLNDEVLRQRETMNRLMDENGFVEEGEN